MRRQDDRHRRGNTLVETMVSLGVLGILGGGVFGMVQDSDDVFQSSLRNSKARMDTMQSFEVLRRELQQASLSSFTIDETSPDGDVITFQVPLSLNGNQVLWGATLKVGGQRFEYADHFIRFQLRADPEGSLNLVRQMIDPSGAQVGDDEILARNVDPQDAQGLKGFRVIRAGSFLNLALRIQTCSAPSNNTAPCSLRTHSSMLRFRNR